VRIFAGNFAPNGWAFCHGQLLPISQNTALFSLILTTYGGDGMSTFALPDLRGRVPIHPGQGPGLNNRVLGESAGAEVHTLSTAEIPAHTHTMGASATNGAADSPAGGVLARTPAGIPQYATTADANLSPAAVTLSGGGQPHNNMQPYLTVNYIIALQGIFPSRP
jgi:microcystin-dependent protein